MDDDFHTALAIGYMFTLSKEINVYANNVINKGAEYDAVHFRKLMDVYGEMAGIIGIFESSEIRDSLKAQGILLEDSAAGTKWKKA